MHDGALIFEKGDTLQRVVFLRYGHSNLTKQLTTGGILTCTNRHFTQQI